MSQESSSSLMAKRKEIVRQIIRFRNSGDQKKADELEAEAARLLEEASKSGDGFTVENAYGLMAH